VTIRGMKDYPSPPCAMPARRDYALLFLYNTGARADEAAEATIGDLTLAKAIGKEHSSVLMHGRERNCDAVHLWQQTVAELARLMGSRSSTGICP
jgi:integrase/recombinase XerD